MGHNQLSNEGRQVRGGIASTLIVALVCLIVGAVGGVLVYRQFTASSWGSTIVGKAAVNEDELDLALGTYVVDGEEVRVTVREAIEETSSLDAVKNDDGTYDVPSADVVLSIARNRILLDAAAEQGLAATDEDALAYARDLLGTDDISLIAANYNMGPDQAREHLREAALLAKLKDAVVGTSTAVEPQPPVPPEAGAEDTPLPEYAHYITELAGSEWDAAANRWSSDEGAYRQRLRDYTVSNEEATYSAAQAAYEEAMAQYAAAERQSSTEWTDYVNGLLSEASVELLTLVA